ncbi:hydrogenase maturation protease [Allosalinactinospora lopnorensis]|uniref:hydrogenase maturation protease n=1 Tax=Allosalinactinospora lopnorensis TaxID=1352348 RepID=UPI000623D191|nr:hydrogenase maturation protease [Allosalinactinospora lopnorensis]
MTARTLIAGVGNIFLGDDAFGVEVVRRLADRPLPDGVRAEDFGIRGVHLAYELLDGYDALVMIDATPRGGMPGTLYMIEVGPEDVSAPDPNGPGPLMDAHDLTPDTVFALLTSLGGRVGTIHVVGCEPECVEERMGLSEPVSNAVEDAARMVWELVTSKEPKGHS